MADTYRFAASKACSSTKRRASPSWIRAYNIRHFLDIGDPKYNNRLLWFRTELTEEDTNSELAGEDSYRFTIRSILYNGFEDKYLSFFPDLNDNPDANPVLNRAFKKLYDEAVSFLSFYPPTNGALKAEVDETLYNGQLTEHRSFKYNDDCEKEFYEPVFRKSMPTISKFHPTNDVHNAARIVNALGPLFDFVPNPAKNYNPSLHKAVTNKSKVLNERLWVIPETVYIDFVSVYNYKDTLFVIIKNLTAKIKITDCQGEIEDQYITYKLAKSGENNDLAIRAGTFEGNLRLETSYTITDVKENITNNKLNSIAVAAIDTYKKFRTDVQTDRDIYSFPADCETKLNLDNNEQKFIATIYNFIEDKIKYIEKNIKQIVKEELNIDIGNPAGIAESARYKICIDSIDNEDTDFVDGQSFDSEQMSRNGLVLDPRKVQFTNSK